MVLCGSHTFGLCRIRDACNGLFSYEFNEMKVEPFGGFVNGLGTKGSDLDVVLTGMMSPDGFAGGQPLHSLILMMCLSQVFRTTRKLE